MKLKLTQDGKVVASGLSVFKLIDTEGLPLSIVLTYLCDEGYVVDWIEFYNKCREVGWRHDRIMSKLEEALADSYPKEFNKVVLERLGKMGE